MGYTIGDVLTIIGFVSAILFAIWALMVSFALLFPMKAEKARRETEEHPWRAFFVGAVFNTVVTILATFFTSLPPPLLKLIGWGFYLVLLGTMAVGASGLALLAAERIRQMDRRRSSYRALERGAMLMVICAILPVFGWFGFAPILFMIAGGAGFRSLFLKRRAAEPVRATHESGAASGEFVV